MKEMFHIYAIQHNATKRIYIGSTKQTILDRYKGHITSLREGKHANQLMQSEYDEKGEDYTVFELESGEDSIVDHPYYDNKLISFKAVREYSWMDKYDTINSEYGYNCDDRSAKSFIKRKRIFESVQMNIEKGLPRRRNER